jgi:hypothetical protein
MTRAPAPLIPSLIIGTAAVFLALFGRGPFPDAPTSNAVQAPRLSLDMRGLPI